MQVQKHKCAKTHANEETSSAPWQHMRTVDSKRSINETLQTQNAVITKALQGAQNTTETRGH